MGESFIKLLELVPKKDRTERVIVMLALLSASEDGIGSVRTAMVREILDSHLRAESPSNVSDVLRKAVGYVQAIDGQAAREWRLTETGLSLLWKLTSRDLSHRERTKENSMYSVDRMHPSIREVSQDLLLGGHPAEAIGRAAKRLNQMVRTKTSRTRDEGTSMMYQVFSQNPNGHKRLLLGHLQEDWQRDRQEGLKMMMAGVQLAIANVDKHGVIEIADATQAVEVLSILSFLARSIDECELAD